VSWGGIREAISALNVFDDRMDGGIAPAPTGAGSAAVPPYGSGGPGIAHGGLEPTLQRHRVHVGRNPRSGFRHRVYGNRADGGIA
jgi:hypothetical protein